jgi:hypothetical protein
MLLYPARRVNENRRPASDRLFGGPTPNALCFANQPIKLLAYVLPKPKHRFNSRRVLGMRAHVTLENLLDLRRNPDELAD